jgi:hypothetical protein
MIFLGASCFPAIKDNGDIVTFSFMVFHEGFDQLISLLLEVLMIDADEIVAVNDN